jgi:beta-lactam-binding protein with PASTA domain
MTAGRRRTLLGFGLLVPSLLALAAAAAFRGNGAAPATTPPVSATVGVPSGLKGRDLAAAEAIVRAAGLTPSSTPVASAARPGVVLEAEPPAGRLPRGDRVILVYARAEHP